jgi:hypothetical protein
VALGANAQCVRRQLQIGEAMDDKELLWKQYELNVNLYRSYLELAIKVNIFYHAITEGILSFYFANQDKGFIKYSLVFPLVMSIAFACFFIFGAERSRITRREIFSLRDKLGFEAAPEMLTLMVFLVISAFLFILVAATLGWLLLCR